MGSPTRRWFARPRRAVVFLTAFALAARLLTLSERAVHWDEARVGYWVLRSVASGNWEYHSILHGPFVQHATRLLFATVGPSRFTMRLPVALIGGLLPLAALLFRSRLADDEVVALALVLAVNPLLLYFSRFMRSDVLLAAFVFVSLGAAVRLLDTGRPRWLYLSTVALALGFTAKENVLLYLLSWAGAATLVAARNLLAVDDPASSVRAAVGVAAAQARRWWYHVGASALLFAVVFLFFYAPRAGTPGAVGLWNAVARPSLFPAVLEAATLGTWEKVRAVWLSGQYHNDSYVLFTGYYALVLAVGAAPATAMALVGGIRDRRRELVAFCGWWALSSFVGYPYAADIAAPWLAVHVVLAMAIPAAVGLAAVVRTLDGALASQQRLTAAIVAGLLLVSGLQVAVVAGVTSYTHPPSPLSPIAQAGQPGTNVHPTIERARAAAAANDPGDVDVLYVGELAVENESENDDLPAESNWYSRLPLPWYTEVSGMHVASATRPADVGPDPPPVVIVFPEDSHAVAANLPGYEAHRESLLLWPGERTFRVLGFERHVEGQSIVVFVDEDAVPAR